MRVFSVPRWALWTAPPRVVAPVVLVEITTLLLVVVHLTSSPLPIARDLGIAALLTGAGLVHTEIAMGIERVRQRVTAPGLHVDLGSVWTFAGALLLPPAVAAAVAVVLQIHVWRRAWYPRVPLYRQVFSASTVILACIGASAVLHNVGTGIGPEALDNPNSLLAIGLALLVYTTVNTALVAGAIMVSSVKPDVAAAVGRWDDNLLELSTLSLGGLAAVAISLNPVLVLLLFPPLLVLHRAVLVRHLEEAATTDSKTGLLNAAAWHTQAERALHGARGDRRRAVLVLDLDHFKSVNDTHGHIVGDHVLVAIADALRAEVRDRDLVGRFGGEEFVVLLAGWDGSNDSDLEAVADRIRRRVAALHVEIPTPDGPLSIGGLSVSVGGAVYPGDGADVGTLLRVADAALYDAKRAGRNVVRMGVPDLPEQELPTRVGNESVGESGARQLRSRGEEPGNIQPD